MKVAAAAAAVLMVAEAKNLRFKLAVLGAGANDKNTQRGGGCKAPGRNPSSPPSSSNSSECHTHNTVCRTGGGGG